MARELGRVNVNDLTENSYKVLGIGINRSSNSNGTFATNYTTLNQAKDNLKNLILTRKGERLMQPRFGTIIWDLLFEPLTEQLKNLIVQNVNEILNHDPRVQAGNVLVTPYDTGLEIQCTLKYVPYNIQQSLQLKFDQANGLLTA